MTNFGEIGTDAHNKQTWRVERYADSTFRFESTYWDKGNYLYGYGKWLYADDYNSESWWKVTPSTL